MANWLQQRILDGAKAAGAALPFAFPQSGAGGGGGSFVPLNGAGAIYEWGGSGRGGNINYEAEVGHAWLNSGVMACLGWQINAWPEARPSLHSVNPDDTVTVARADPYGINNLLDNPNDSYDSTVLWAGTLISWGLTGNAYWFVVRDRFGVPAQLWYIPHFQVQPYWAGSDFITGYKYFVNGQTMYMPPEDVIHFRFGFNPLNMRLGLARLQSILREIFTDSEATAYTAAILRNMGILGLFISPDYSKLPAAVNTIPTWNEQELADKMDARITGTMRGKTVASTLPINIASPGQSPDKMALDNIRRYPEARICSAFGLSPMLVGLTSGLERSTFSNFEQAVQAGWQSSLLPSMRMMAKQGTMQLLNPLLPPAQVGKYVIEFDTSKIRALQPDMDKLHTRARNDWTSNLLTRADAKKQIGMEPAKDGSDNIHYADIAPPRSGGFDQETDGVPAVVTETVDGLDDPDGKPADGEPQETVDDQGAAPPAKKPKQ